MGVARVWYFIGVTLVVRDTYSNTFDHFLLDSSAANVVCHLGT